MHALYLPDHSHIHSYTHREIRNCTTAVCVCVCVIKISLDSYGRLDSPPLGRRPEGEVSWRLLTSPLILPLPPPYVFTQNHLNYFFQPIRKEMFPVNIKSQKSVTCIQFSRFSIVRLTSNLALMDASAFGGLQQL